tara:strand:- start:5738 stop:6073 length:336 start_codon:yes stop_codon:yes gene_type:complete
MRGAANQLLPSGLKRPCASLAFAGLAHPLNQWRKSTIPNHTYTCQTKLIFSRAKNLPLLATLVLWVAGGLPLPLSVSPLGLILMLSSMATGSAYHHEGNHIALFWGFCFAL